MSASSSPTAMSSRSSRSWLRRRCAIPSSSPRSSSTKALWKEISWYDGKAYGFPFTALTMFMPGTAPTCWPIPRRRKASRRNTATTSAPAQDWKQYRDIAEWFTRPDQGLYGTALQGKRHEALWYEWLNFLYSFGGDMLEVKTRLGMRSGHRQQPAGDRRDRVLQEPDGLLAAGHAQLFLGRRDGADAAGQGRRADHVERRDLCRRRRRERLDGRRQDGLRPRAAGRGRQGRPRSRAGPTSIPTSSKNKEAAYLFIQWMMEYDQQLEPASQRRRHRAAGRLCLGRGAEAALRQGVDGLQRSRPSQSRRSRRRAR